MTQEQSEPASSAPKPRSKPPTRRKPPAARAKRPDPLAVGENGSGATAEQPTIADKLAELDAQIAELKLQAQGGMRTVASKPANLIGTARVAADEELTPWQLRVRERTEPTPRHLERREKNYNYPEKWYMKPDGSVVKLQGDPQNYTYYTTRKKFYALPDEEAREYETVERSRIVKLQQQKASLINTIRRAVQLDPALAAGLDPAWELDLDRMSINELAAQLDEIAGMPTASGGTRRLMKRLPRLQDADDAAAEAESKRMLAGVEVNKRDMSEFDRAIGIDRPNIPQPRRSREIEVTPQNARQFQ